MLIIVPKSTRATDIILIVFPLDYKYALAVTVTNV